MPLFTRHTLAAALLMSSAGLGAQAAIPLVLLPDAQIAEAVTQAAVEPLRYAVDYPLGHDLRHGAWDEPLPGVARWRLQLRSPGASSLSARLDHLRLPPGAELWFYDSEQRERQGPLHPQANGTLWTPMVRAQDAVLELRVAAAARGDARLVITSVQHGYRDPAQGPRTQAEGDAGSCNVDVACVGDGWPQQARATVMLTVGNTTACTGTLVNNLNQDDRALVLTANHCGIHTDANAESTFAYFGVQKNRCGASAPAPRTLNIAGQRLLARDAQSDVALFTLATQPGPAHNAYYAGWNADASAIPRSGATIHHPRSDDKKISLFSSAARRENGVHIDGLPSRVDVWTVQWSSGVTEPASSGAGLWNRNKQVVGVLSGGETSCLNATAVDYFGRLDRAWTASPANSGQLKAHLDPDDTGCRAMAGKEPGGAAIPGCSTSEGTAAGKDSGGGALPLSLLLLLSAAGLRRRQAWIKAVRPAMRTATWLRIIISRRNNAPVSEGAHT